ncbi:hypothetical protein BS17DRAFT_689233 [Gyrodon lividus]|nr:hypothetical protein BS17DRAFT_689233 [Gyrodon lividus]
MHPNSCIMFTGPFGALEACSLCGEQLLQRTCGCTKTAAQKFITIPIAPQIQALYCSLASATDM